MLTVRTTAKYRALLKRALSRKVIALGYTATDLEAMRQVWRELPTPALHTTNRLLGDIAKIKKG